MVTNTASRLGTGVVNVSFVILFIIIWLSNRRCLLMYLDVKGIISAIYSQIFKKHIELRYILSLFISISIVIPLGTGARETEVGSSERENRHKGDGGKKFGNLGSGFEYMGIFVLILQYF